MPEATAYRYPLEECDVPDRTALATFRSRRSRWLETLGGDDRHSIWNRIYELIWNDTVYRVVLEARRLAHDNPSPSVAINGAVSELFDIGFAVTQTMGIRRLLDTTKGAVSLPRLVADIKQNHSLLTREMYVCHDGLPYDYRPVRDSWQRDLLQSGARVGCLSGEGPANWASSEDAHETFDRLARVPASRRSRHDMISLSWLRATEAHLAQCKPVLAFVNNFVAHAVEAQKRAALTPEQASVTLEKLDVCYKTIYTSANFLSGPVLFAHGSAAPLAVPQYNQLDGLDKPWVAPGDLSSLCEVWDAREATVGEWSNAPWPGGRRRREESEAA